MPILCPEPQAVYEDSWEPPADVYRAPSGWVIKLELAGVEPKDITIELRGKKLCVRGFRRDWIVEQGWRHMSMEISYSHFHKNIELPADIGEVMISNEFKYGMLLIYLTIRGGAL